MTISDRTLMTFTFGVMLWALTNMGLTFGDWYDLHYGARLGTIHETTELPLHHVEMRLKPIGTAKKAFFPHDWLSSHSEPGQTFKEYFSIEPVRKTSTRHTIYITLVGEFTEQQLAILKTTRDYLSTFFRVPVKLLKTMPSRELPEAAFRVDAHGVKQVLTGYLRNEILKPSRPNDALASLAFTNVDLTPGEGWNYVFGDASLEERIGVWSLHRMGDPAKDRDTFRLCLKRTMGLATHETGHILSIYHCTTFECNMNGSNHLEEADHAPMTYCPVCTRKICWNLDVEPVAWFQSLKNFYQLHKFDDEVFWCERAILMLQKPLP
jgi:archaemetzincin